MDYQQRYNRKMAAERSAVGLGWFSIGLGLTEIFFAGALARWMGMKGQEGLLRLYGVREVATGLGIFAARDKAPWIWGRVAGDALDMATLAAHAADNPRKGNLAIAMGAVAGAAAMDVATAQALSSSQASLRPRLPVRDYSDRSGFPRGIEAARGAAMKDFEAPRDMRTPEGMRPSVH